MTMSGGEAMTGAIRDVRFRVVIRQDIPIRRRTPIPRAGLHTRIGIQANLAADRGTTLSRSTTATRTATTRGARMHATTTRLIRCDTADIDRRIADTTG